MCNRHSFCLTPAGKVIDGCGLTNSHTQIMGIHGLTAARHDTCNLYEWQPPQGWPDANWALGLTVDRAQFAPKARATTALERHLVGLYPTMAEWNLPDVIRWSALPLPDAARVQRAYELALRAQPLGVADDALILELVNLHLRRLGCNVVATAVVNATNSVWGSVWDSVRDSVWGSVWDSVRDSVWGSVWDSVWGSVWDSVRDSVRDSVWDSVWDSVRDSVACSMVRDDADNPWMPLAELATHGVYLWSVADDGTAYVWMRAS